MIQISDVFQLVDAVRQRVLAYREVFRRAVVDVQRVDAEAQQVSSFSKETSLHQALSGKYIVPFRVGIAVTSLTASADPSRSRNYHRAQWKLITGCTPIEQ